MNESFDEYGGNEAEREEELDRFFRHVDSVLWPVFVHAALRRAVTSSQYLYLGRTEFVRIMRSSLRVSELEVLWQAEASKSSKRVLTYTGFKRCVAHIATRLGQARGLRPLDAFIDFLQTHCAKGTLPRHKRVTLSYLSSTSGLTELRVSFNNTIADFFACFAKPPTPFETQILRRHSPRIDVDTARQSLSMTGWTQFCQALKLHSRLSATTLITVFVDIIPVSAVDDLGGLDRDEFSNAFFRLALLLSPQTENVPFQNDSISTPRTTNKNHPEMSPHFVKTTRRTNTRRSSTTIYDPIFNTNSARKSSYESDNEQNFTASRQIRQRCLAGLEFIRSNLADVISAHKSNPRQFHSPSSSSFLNTPPELDSVDLTGILTQRRGNSWVFDSHLFIRAVVSFNRILDKHKFIQE